MENVDPNIINLDADILLPDDKMNMLREKTLADLGIVKDSGAAAVIKQMTKAYFSAGMKRAIEIVQLGKEGKMSLDELMVFLTKKTK